MSFSKQAWSQLKNLTADDLLRALSKDNWTPEEKIGAVQAYRKERENGTIKRITIHYHPQKTYGPGLLKQLLADTEWSEADMRKLKLIK